jgi:hypothetical protein
MGILDADDTKAARGLFGVVIVLVAALAMVAISSAGVLGLAFRVFQLAAG